jgi:hypothetical protein
MNFFEFFNHMESVATKQGAPPIEPPTYDDRGDEGGDFDRDGFWKWLNSNSPCLKSIFVAVAEIVLEDLKPVEGYPKIRVQPHTNPGSGMGMIDFALQADGKAIFPQLKKIVEEKLVRGNCDLWKAIHIPQEMIWTTYKRFDNDFTNDILTMWFGNPMFIGERYKGDDYGQWLVYEEMKKAPHLKQELETKYRAEVPGAKTAMMMHQYDYGKFHVDRESKIIYLTGYRAYAFRADNNSLGLQVNNRHLVFSVVDYGFMSKNDNSGEKGDIRYYEFEAFGKGGELGYVRVMVGPQKLGWNDDLKDMAKFDSIKAIAAEGQKLKGYEEPDEDATLSLLQYSAEWICKHHKMNLILPERKAGHGSDWDDKIWGVGYWGKRAYGTGIAGNGRFHCNADKGTLW